MPLQLPTSMLVFRSLAIGLLAASFALLLTRPRLDVRYVPLPVHDYARLPSFRAGPKHEPPTIIDAAPGITAAQLADTIRLGPDEHIAAIDNVQTGTTLSAGLLLAARTMRSGEFIDIDIAGPAGSRRVLVLLH